VLSGLGGKAASGEFETPAFAPPGNETALHPKSVSMSGGNQAHDNRQPYLTFNFCIALSGATRFLYANRRPLRSKRYRGGMPGCSKK
jgi:hypothetical protein